MEFDDLLITTGVDALVRLVKEKKKLELEEASKTLSIPNETIEEWARVLEEEGIIKIEYRLTRLYLVWVQPSTEDISNNTRRLEQEKQRIETDVELAKNHTQKQEQEINDLKKAFDDFYLKAQPKLAQMEKSVDGIPAAKQSADEYFSKQRESVENMEIEMHSIRIAIEELKNEMKSLNISSADAESKTSLKKAEIIFEDISKMQKELADLKRQSEENQPTDVALPSAMDVKKKYDLLAKEFSQLRSKNAQLRQDLINLEESSEIIRSVADSIVGHEDRFTSMRSELNELSSSSEQLLEKSKQLHAKISEQKDLLGRINDSVTVAKGLMSRFPSSDKLKSEIEVLKQNENSMIEKMSALEKILDVIGGKGNIGKQFIDLSKRIEDKSFQLRQEMDTLAASLEDEKSTYLTFQKIKDKILPSIESYSSQLGILDTKLSAVRKEANSEKDHLNQEALKILDMLKGDQMQKVVSISDEIRTKKKLLDDLKKLMDDLFESTSALNKRMVLLSKQSKLLDIRKEGETENIDSKRSEIQQELQISSKEEESFKKKRDELKGLIKKLWDEQ